MNEEAIKDLPAVLTATDVAKILRVDRKFIYQLFAEGKLPFGKRIGRVIRFPTRAFFAWLNTQDKKRSTGK